MRVPRPPGTASATSLVLKGDTAAFDNTLYVADEKKEEATVLFVGDDKADDPAGLLYYLIRVFPDTSRRSVHVTPRPPGSPLAWESDRTLPLVILTAETSPENARRLREYVKGGGTLAGCAGQARPGRDTGSPRGRRAAGRRGAGAPRRRDARRDRLRSSAVRPAGRRRSTAISPRSTSGNTGSSISLRSAARGSWPGSRTATRPSWRSRSARGASSS